VVGASPTPDAIYAGSYSPLDKRNGVILIQLSFSVARANLSD
jgi:hypothetical protein